MKKDQTKKKRNPNLQSKGQSGRAFEKQTEIYRQGSTVITQKAAAPIRPEDRKPCEVKQLLLGNARSEISRQKT